MVTFQSVQCHPGLTYIFKFLTFGHSGAQGWPLWQSPCNQLTPLPLKVLKEASIGDFLVTHDYVGTTIT